MSMRTVNDWHIVGFEQYGKVFGIDRLTATLDAGEGFTSGLAAMFATEFYSVFLKTIIWTVVNVALHVIIGVFLAILLNRHLPGKAIFRVLLILPWAVPQYITALTWRGMFNTDSGAVNAILGAVFSIDPIPWLTEETLAFTAAIITNVWLGFPFMMIIALGALQSIPRELYEAADIDGASAWNKFRHVTVPLLKPVMIPAITLGVVWTFNNINIIWLVTNGGQPADTSHILVSYVYRAAFNLYRYGYAAAFSMIIFLLLAAWSIFFMRKTSVTETVY
jgi:arabinogalactan oligomer/maltooligosaccharide transport system permease protein